MGLYVHADTRGINYVFNLDNIAWAERDEQSDTYTVWFIGMSEPVYLDYDASRVFVWALSEAEKEQKEKRRASQR